MPADRSSSRLLATFRSPGIVSCEDLSWGPSRTIEPHTHDFYQLDYFYGGYGTVSAAKTRYSVTPGDVFIANPADIHEFRAAAALPLQGLSFKFCLHGAKPLPRFSNYIGNLAVLPKDSKRDLEDLLRRACAEDNSSRYGHREIAGALLGAFLLLMVRAFQDHRRDAVSDGGGRAIDAIRGYIRACYHLPLTLADLGRVAGLNPRYLCQKFSRQIGRSPIAVLTEERMQVAKRLLRSTQLPIARIGEDVGYPDIYHFSKRFKAVVGSSPKAYRTATRGKS
ncbi:MAG: helix-turn-helix transcriptional regulator [Planctomycetes bacterium]|nr:helix-turn-helix transcriptional regulator [Planctomycetota bacterium]